MIQLLRYTLFFWRTYLVRTLLTKRMALVALGCCVPPVIGWFVLTVPRHPPPPIQAFLFPSFLLTLQMMVPLAAVIGGAAVISEEIDDRTITYLLTRPIPRPSILLGRWLATLTILFAFVGTSIAALGAVVEYKAAHPTVHPVVVEPAPSDDEEHADDPDATASDEHAGADKPVDDKPADEHVATDKPSDDKTADEHAGNGRSHSKDDRRAGPHRRPEPPKVLVEAMPDNRLPSGLLAELLTAALLGTAVYSALFAVLGTFLKHPMIVGLGYCFAIEAFLANLPGVSQSWTIQYYMRSYLLSTHGELWRTFELADLQLHDTAAQALTKLVSMLVVTLVIGCITIRRKQYVLSA
jgi:hypothetical protein